MASQDFFQPGKIPRYMIDLSLPPKERYRVLAKQYSTRLKTLTGLFDALLIDSGLPRYLISTVNHISRLLLRRVYSSEETDELRGISEQTQIPMYLLVSLNVILDLLMGCTSGGVRSLEPGRPRAESKMLHFRILDWGMDGLRDIIVQLDFVKSKSTKPQEIIASSITYVGFVGCLTGVRRGLSISLNFRAIHDDSTWFKQFKFYGHHLLVLLGWQPSIGSVLRSYVLGDKAADMSASVRDFCSRRTTAAYVIFSDGQRSVIVDKDLVHTGIRESDVFIAVTNHDVATSTTSNIPHHTVPTIESFRDVAGMGEIIIESKDRLDCIQKKWSRRVQRSGTKRTSVSSCSFVTQRVLRSWLRDWPTSNESTHFAAIMDPEAGVVIWSEVYLIRNDINLHPSE